MKLNEHQALYTRKVLLVPYSSHHVPTYHLWMQDPALQAATASEPLSLTEEYAMQQSWRNDADKLTFIACTMAAPTPTTASTSGGSTTTASPSTPHHITATKQDEPTFMIGDINLFLTPDNEDDNDDEAQAPTIAHRSPTRPLLVIGEVEVMIAEKAQQGKGLGREILLAFLWYILTSLDALMLEYHGVHGSGRTASQMKWLRVKIDKDNLRSIKLFEGVGFTKADDKPNYFGELELRYPISTVSRERVESMMEAAPKVVEYKS